MMFLIELGVSVTYAFATLVIGWSGIALLVCALVGAALRLRFDRDSAILLGGIVVGLIFAVDSVLIGLEIGNEVARGGDDPVEAYMVVVVPVVAWLVHLPMGLGVLRLAILALEASTARMAGRSGRAPNLPA